jgi:hypothetical protein
LKKDTVIQPMPPLDGYAVKSLEDALGNSPSKVIRLEINHTIYQLSREGHWFKFSLLTKKNTVKRSTIFQTITEIYNQIIHGQDWRIAEIY